MLEAFSRIWNTLFAPREWEPYGDPKSGQWMMRRWYDGKMEHREATCEEARYPSWWQANR